MKDNQTRWIKFLGGRNIIFTLVVLILMGFTFLLYSQLDFILNPILTILSAILTPLIISFILFYLLEPLVEFIENRGVPRLWSVVILYLLIFGLIVLLLVWLIPILQQQFEDLIGALPDLFDQVTDFITNLIGDFIVTDNQRDAFQEGLDYFSNIESNIINYLTDGLSGIGNVLSSVTNAVIILFLVPVILFFLLKDGAMFVKGFMEKTPPKAREDVAALVAAIDEQVGNYIKGQIIVAAINGMLMFLGFTLIGLNYSGVLAVAGGILSFIPYLGPTLTFIPAVIIALGDSLWMVVKLIIVWLVVQFIEGNLIEPNVMGNRLKVHPVTIIFVLLIMGELLGIVGMILGVPIYAIIKVLVTFAYQKFQRRYNKYYGDEEGEYEVRSLQKVYGIEEETETLRHAPEEE